MIVNLNPIGWFTASRGNLIGNLQRGGNDMPVIVNPVFGQCTYTNFSTTEMT